MAIETQVYIAASLDGFIAREDGSLDWLNVSDPEEGRQLMAEFEALLSEVDCLIMGRKTLETVVQFERWPYGDLPVFVLSTRLTAPPEIPGSRISVRNCRPGALLDELESEGFERAYIDGGVTIQRFLEDGMIDRMTIAVVPVLLGQGRPLFRKMDREIALRLVETTSYPSGIVKSTYVARVEA
jgi:dihydrofolate reductase